MVSKGLARNGDEDAAAHCLPAGAKLHVIDGFAGMGREVVTVVGTADGYPEWVEKLTAAPE